MFDQSLTWFSIFFYKINQINQIVFYTLCHFYQQALCAGTQEHAPEVPLQSLEGAPRRAGKGGLCYWKGLSVANGRPLQGVEMVQTEDDQYQGPLQGS